jgi:ribosomal protein S18 acetylase RimI-like enzyme
MPAHLVRRAEPADAAAIVELVNRVALTDDTLGIDRFPLSPQDEAQFLRAADPRVYLTLVATDGVDQRHLGVLTASRGVDQKLRHVSALAIAVSPDARRRGLGRSLLDAFAAWAQNVGVEKCTLSVLATNEAAIALFESAGFRWEATRKGQFRIQGQPVDELLMARWIGGAEAHHA